MDFDNFRYPDRSLTLEEEQGPEMDRGADWADQRDDQRRLELLRQDKFYLDKSLWEGLHLDKGVLQKP